jgi:hypothetical protein
MSSSLACELLSRSSSVSLYDSYALSLLREPSLLRADERRDVLLFLGVATAATLGGRETCRIVFATSNGWAIKQLAYRHAKVSSSARVFVHASPADERKSRSRSGSRSVALLWYEDDGRAARGMVDVCTEALAGIALGAGPIDGGI